MATFDLLSHTTYKTNTNIKALDVVEVFHQETLTAAADLTAGQPVRINSAGKFAAALADTATNADMFGIVIQSAKAGQGVTVVRKGILAGMDLDALAYWAKVYLSDTGAMASSAGTSSRVIGHVVPLRGQVPGSSPMKGLLVEIATV